MGSQVLEEARQRSTLMVIQEEAGAVILSRTRVVGRCADPNEARRIARLIEAGDTKLPKRPKGAAAVTTVENEDGSVSVLVGLTTVVTCPERDVAEELSVLLEVAEENRGRLIGVRYIPPVREEAAS